MRRSSSRRPVGPSLVLAVATLAIVLGLAGPAAAHDPIFLGPDQSTPETGPYLPDGTISFALYGSLLRPGDTRGLEFDLRDGDDLYLSMLIPDLEPEIGLAEPDLPVMTLITPDGSERSIAPEVREPFADPFSGTNYVTLYETVEPAAGGRHQLVVSGQAPTRFVVAVGTREEFFTPTERSGDRPTSFPGIAEPLNEWYTTPADGSAPVDADGGDEVDVDVEMIDEALEELDEQEAADESADSDSGAESVTAATAGDEAAAPAGDDDGGGSTTWIAPVALLAVALAAGGLLLRRRLSA